MKHISFPNGQTEAQPKRSDRRLCRRAFSKGLALGSLILAAVIVLTGGLVYGEGGGDALFIDPNGNVGIGTRNPKAKLEIASPTDGIALRLGRKYGQPSIKGLGDWLILDAPKVDAPKEGKIGLNYYEKGDVIIANGGGNVGIGTRNPKAKLEIAEPTEGIALKIGRKALQPSIKGLGDWLILDAPKEGRIGLNYWEKGNVIIAKGGGNVGIGTEAPKARLDIKGKGSDTVDLKVSGRIRSNSARGGLWLSDKDDGFVGNNGDNVGFWTKGGNWAFQIKKSNGNVGIGTKDPKAKLHVNGNVQVQKQLEVNGDLFVRGKLAYYWSPDKRWKSINNKGGNVAGSSNTEGPTSSDLRFKSELQSIPSALNKILNLRGVTYRWNDDALRYFTRDIEDTLSAGPNATEAENHKLWQAEREKRYIELAKINVGIIAQDVEAVLPEAVTTAEEGYKSVRYHDLIPLLIEALKEQDKTVKDQAQVVAQQQQEIARLVVANLAVQQQLAELATVKAQVAMLEAAVQRVAATQASGASDAVAHLFKTKAH